MSDSSFEESMFALCNTMFICVITVLLQIFVHAIHTKQKSTHKADSDSLVPFFQSAPILEETYFFRIFFCSYVFEAAILKENVNKV